MTDQSARGSDDNLDAETLAEGVGDLFGAKGGKDAKPLQPGEPPSEEDEAASPTR